MADLISYETIRSVQRAEKSDTLQPLPENFFSAVKEWLNRKRNQKDNMSLLELENAKKLIEDIVNRRQKKIVMAALRTVRGELPPSNLSEDEQKLFDSVVADLKRFKSDINEGLFNYSSVVEDNIREAKENLNEIKSNKIEKSIENEKVKEFEPSQETSKKNIKFLVDTPRFVASDLNYYGPFRNGDVAELPEKVADVLASRNIAEIV